MNVKILAASVLALCSVSAFAADVGVSISVGQPGFYGRLDIGGYPPPPVIYQQPVLVERPVRYVETAPIYLRVPPGHARNWGKHCHAYHACNQRVLFVQDRWYHNEYVPRYHERHGDHGRFEGYREERHDHHDHHGHHGEHGRGHGQGHGRD
ncbi:hypothetical protein [Duganella callida]|uniref:DUF3300 domain-containing protein n=1 Tax=Duganella callida TaxID=2561932 RepID=A0A4Y9SXL2_9BURK|nr:hypothetical protein [Duganella callida]TFW30089.1 hypothetical protein E4L98_02775 [Duganella callida]